MRKAIFRFQATGSKRKKNNDTQVIVGFEVRPALNIGRNKISRIVVGLFLALIILSGAQSSLGFDGAQFFGESPPLAPVEDFTGYLTQPSKEFLTKICNSLREKTGADLRILVGKSWERLKGIYPDRIFHAQNKIKAETNSVGKDRAAEPSNGLGKNEMVIYFLFVQEKWDARILPQGKYLQILNHKLATKLIWEIVQPHRETGNMVAAVELLTRRVALMILEAENKPVDWVPVVTIKDETTIRDLLRLRFYLLVGLSLPFLMLLYLGRYNQNFQAVILKNLMQNNQDFKVALSNNWTVIKVVGYVLLYIVGFGIPLTLGHWLDLEPYFGESCWLSLCFFIPVFTDAIRYPRLKKRWWFSRERDEF